MKPYFLVFRNMVKFTLKKLKCQNLEVDGVQMFDKNSKLLFNKNCNVIIGKHTVSDGRCVIVVDEGAKLLIGNNCYFNEDAMISVKSSVKIGNGVKFGPNVKVFDNNHLFSKESGVSDSHNSSPIVIGDNTWLASNVVVLKGTTIGKNCVIGANCVVKGNIPDCSIVTNSRKLKIKPME